MNSNIHLLEAVSPFVEELGSIDHERTDSVTEPPTTYQPHRPPWGQLPRWQGECTCERSGALASMTIAVGPALRGNRGIQVYLTLRRPMFCVNQTELRVTWTFHRRCLEPASTALGVFRTTGTLPQALLSPPNRV